MMRHDPNVDYDPLDVGPLCRVLTDAGAQVLDTDIDYDRIVRVKDERLASSRNLREVRDLDLPNARRITEREVYGWTTRALRIRARHPWTLLLASRRVL